ncbi:DUF1152 domain-containing protein [Nocardia sp. NPDC057663]|uniref:DUF1152 domain-containing protein n=1 Tax=Nocardia sp. NPDC057663 TaxID=3346201 RepID=UPI0036708501
MPPGGRRCPLPAPTLLVAWRRQNHGGGICRDIAAQQRSADGSKVATTTGGGRRRASIQRGACQARKLGGREVAILTATDVAEFEPIWSWHPSEADDLLDVAASGWRGTVETRRDNVVQLVDSATRVKWVAAEILAEDSLATLAMSTTTLDEIEHLLRSQRGYIDIDSTRLMNHSAPRTPTADVLDEIDRYANGAARSGVDALTVRRVIELAGTTEAPAAESLRELLATSCMVGLWGLG